MKRTLRSHLLTVRPIGLTLLLMPPGFVVLASLGAPYGAALGTALLFAAGAATWLCTEAPRPVPTRRRGLTLLLWLASFAWLSWIQRSGLLIQGQDVLFVPGLAQRLVETPWLRDAFAPDEPGHAYPPGLPVMFSPLTLLSSGPRQIVAWALLTHAAQAALPLLWARALKRWFHVPLDALSLALILTATMLCLERTVVLGGSFKNAHHVAVGVLVPGVLCLLPRGVGSRPVLGSALLLSGAACAYYPTLHLFVAFVTGWALTDAAARRRVAPHTGRIVVGSAGAAVLAGCWLLSLLAGLGDDPRIPGEAANLQRALRRIFLDPAEKFWFVFGPHVADSAAPGVLGSGARRYALGASLLVCLALPKLVSRLPGTSPRLIHQLGGVARMVLAMTISCLVLAAMVVFAPLTKLGFDYGRWLACVPQIAILAGPFVATALVLRAHLGARLPATALALALVLAIGARSHVDDVRRSRLLALQRGVSVASVEALAALLGTSPGCRAVAESKPVVAGMHHVGAHPLSDVVDVVSSCRLAGGSFLHAPLPGGRAERGLPAGSTLAEWSRERPLWAIGGPALIEDLTRRQPGVRWRRVRSFDDRAGQLWRAEPADVPRS